jgi:predicted DNA-binding transcriptional regulator YafY
VVDATLLSTLAGACRDQLQLRFSYADRQGTPSQREVEPQGVVHAERRWYLVAWDTLRTDWRTFRIDRMTSTAEVGGHFRPRPSPANGDLRAFVVASLSLGPYGDEAQILLHAPVEQVRERMPASVGLLEPVDAQRCLLRCGAHPQGAVVYWLLALELEFEVLGPPALHVMMRDAGARLERSLARTTSAPVE